MERRRRMHLPTTALLFALCSLATAIPWAGPLQTKTPTPVRRDETAPTCDTTGAPALFRRQSGSATGSGIGITTTPRSRGINTCGFQSELYTSPIVCVETDATCVFLYPASIFRCCNDPPDCSVYSTSCVGISDACDSECEANTRVQKCTETASSFCTMNKYDNGGSGWGCGPTSTTVSVFSTWMDHIESVEDIMTVTDTDLLSSFESSRTGTGTGIGTSKGSTLSNTPTSTSTTSTSTSSTSSSNSSSGGSSTNIGAIAGGTVGGLAVIALFVLGLFWLRSRRSNNSSSTGTGFIGAGTAYEPAPTTAYNPPTGMAEMSNETAKPAGGIAPSQHYTGPVYYDAGVEVPQELDDTPASRPVSVVSPQAGYTVGGGQWGQPGVGGQELPAGGYYSHS